LAGAGGKASEGQLPPDLPVWDSKGGGDGSAGRDAQLAFEMWCGAGWAVRSVVAQARGM